MNSKHQVNIKPHTEVLFYLYILPSFEPKIPGILKDKKQNTKNTVWKEQIKEWKSDKAESLELSEWELK